MDGFLRAGSSPQHRCSWANPFFPLVEMSRMYEGCSEETSPLSPAMCCDTRTR